MSLARPCACVSQSPKECQESETARNALQQICCIGTNQLLTHQLNSIVIFEKSYFHSVLEKATPWKKHEKQVEQHPSEWQ